MGKRDIAEVFNVNDRGLPGSFGVDAEGQAYWNGERVVTEQRIALDRWVNRAIIAGGISTVAIAICAVIELCCRA